MSQGPLMPWPLNVSRTVPWLSSTIRQPEPEMTVVPSGSWVVGSEPTITQPLRSTLSAVVRPTPPGQAPPRSPIWANCDMWPPGVTCTIVVPVPWMFEAVVEVADEDAALVQVAGAARDDRDPVGVDVAVRRDRRGQGADGVQGAGECR